MRLEVAIHPRKIALILGIVAVYLAVQSIVAEYVQQTRLADQSDSIAYQLLDLLSVNAEQTIPNWFSASILLTASALLAVIAVAKRSEKDSYTLHWMVLAVIFLYLSIDEAVSIHEILSDPLQQAFHTSGFLAFGWQIVAAPLVLIFALLYLRFLFQLPPRIRNLVIASGVLYVGGALVGDAVGAYQWDISGVTLTYLAMGTVEELCEMLGVVLFIYTLLSYMVGMRYVFTVHSPLIAPESLPSGMGDHLPVSPPLNPSVVNERAAGTPSRWLSRVRPTALVIVLLIGTNAALLYWILARVPESPAPAAATAPFYQSISDQLSADGVTIVQIPGIFAVGDPASRQLSASLLSGFDNVLIVAFPAQKESVAFAGSILPLDRDSLSQLLLTNGETQFMIYDKSALKFIADASSS